MIATILQKKVISQILQEAPLRKHVFSKAKSTSANSAVYVTSKRTVFDVDIIPVQSLSYGFSDLLQTHILCCRRNMNYLYIRSD